MRGGPGTALGGSGWGSRLKVGGSHPNGRLCTHACYICPFSVTTDYAINVSRTHTSDSTSSSATALPKRLQQPDWPPNRTGKVNTTEHKLPECAACQRKTALLGIQLKPWLQAPGAGLEQYSFLYECHLCGRKHMYKSAHYSFVQTLLHPAQRYLCHQPQVPLQEATRKSRLLRGSLLTVKSENRSNAQSHLTFEILLPQNTHISRQTQEQCRCFS